MQVNKRLFVCSLILLGPLLYSGFSHALAANEEPLPTLYPNVPDRLFQTLGPVGATKKEVMQAQEQLRREAKKMDADAVVGMTCNPGGIRREGLTWTKRQAYCRGMAVRFLEKKPEK